MEYDDNADWVDNWDTGEIGSWFTVKLWKNNPDDPSNTRLVNGDYRHTWSGGEITGIGVSSGGLSVSYNLTTQDWEYTYDKGEQYKDEYDC